MVDSKKVKLLIFHPALAPYRVDQFNALSELFDLEVAFLFDNVWNHKFDQSKLLNEVKFKYCFLLRGPSIKTRTFRFGMLKTIRRVNPKIILGFEFSFTTQYLVLLKALGLLPQQLGTMIDDSIAICNNVQSRIRLYSRSFAVKRLDYLVVLSNEVSEFYYSSFDFHRENIVISPILQDGRRLRRSPHELERIAADYLDKYELRQKRVLLFAGRFVAEKGLLNFIKVVTSLLHEQNDVVLILVGDGKERKSINDIVEANNLSGRVLMPGREEGSRLHAWYLCASGFFLPSVFEPFGAVVNEALIFGLPVLCSKYAGATCLLNEATGVIFDPLSHNETILKLITFLDLVEPVESIDLRSKRSLINSHEKDFVSEWQKLLAN